MNGDRIFDSFLDEHSAIRRATWFRERGEFVCVVRSRVGSLDGRPKFSVENVGSRCMPLVAGETVIWPRQNRLEAVDSPREEQSPVSRQPAAPERVDKVGKAVEEVCPYCHGSGWAPVTRQDHQGHTQGERCTMCAGNGTIWEEVAVS